jgi:hypothetical protein
MSLTKSEPKFALGSALRGRGRESQLDRFSARQDRPKDDTLIDFRPGNESSQLLYLFSNVQQSIPRKNGGMDCVGYLICLWGRK